MQKREFLKTLTLAGLSLPFSGRSFDDLLAERTGGSSLPSAGLASDDSFWTAVRDDYFLKPDYINLENGYYSMMPQSVLESSIAQIRDMNAEASHYMRTKLVQDKLAVRQQVASFLGCSAEELIITRNTTESMNTVICGMDWKAGDEAIMAEQDYGAMLDMFRQQSRRFGMVNRMISVPLHPASDEEIVSLYEKQINAKTRLIMLCHIINITGQIMPVKKICEMAHRKGVKVLVDGAHAVAHIDFAIPELGCDYYASSLHKWLSVPLGAGILWVKKENIPQLWPLFGDSSFKDDDIRKLNHTGTHPMHTELCIRYAIGFHQQIGSKRKEERLRYLQHYWTSQLRGTRKLVFNTPEDPSRCCAIANVGIEGVKPSDMAARLLSEFKIWTVAIDSAGVHGCRVTPGIFTGTAELDKLVAALRTMAGS
jgi:selenocysteine lyase/cysteine desulfurase